MRSDKEGVKRDREREGERQRLRNRMNNNHISILGFFLFCREPSATIGIATRLTGTA